MAEWEDSFVSPLKLTKCWTTTFQQRILCSTYKYIWQIHTLGHLKVRVLAWVEEVGGREKTEIGLHIQFGASCSRYSHDSTGRAGLQLSYCDLKGGDSRSKIPTWKSGSYWGETWWWSREVATHDGHCWQSHGFAMAITDIDTKPQNQNPTCSLRPGYRQNPAEAVEIPWIAHYG